jgi:SAM-dependent methyltransferase
MNEGGRSLARPRPHPRLKPGQVDFPYDLKTVLGSSYHMDARKPVDRFLRYERILHIKLRWAALRFEERDVLEIGSGPLLGWGPLAVYLGARSYACVEPRFRQEVLDSTDVQVRFFLPFHQQLEAIYDAHVSFDEFIHRIRSRIVVYSSPIETCRLPRQSADLVISRDVLQHVADLDGAVRQMCRASRTGAMHFHLVNFTDLVSPPNDPFRELYRLTPVEYFEKDSLLNLKRPSDMTTLFRSAGFPVALVPYYVDPDIASRKIADYWKRYELHDLAVQMGFLVSE